MSILCYGFLVALAALAGFDKAAFYEAFSGDQPEVMEAVLTQIRPEIKLQAFTGALEMKLARHAGKPREKVSMFNRGRHKLESAISAEPENVEYRFLRFSIQTICPKILKYHKNLEEDRQMLESAYPRLPDPLRKVVAQFAQEQGGLHLN